MQKFKKAGIAVLLIVMTMGLLGCAATVDQLYRLPRRSEEYENLQGIMDEVMDSLEYSAPASGDNQQAVQTADLDGDGESEILLFAKGGEENPLKILLFASTEEGYEYMTTLESPGTGFDQVEYAQMDGKPGLELIVGRKVSDQVLRNVTVYSFAEGQPKQLLNANYTKFLTCDLTQDDLGDLFVICPGNQEDGRAVGELYTTVGGNLERSTEAELSGPADQLKRIVTGTLQSGEPAVFVASTAGEQSIITDVFAMVRGVFTNVSFSSESGTSVGTLRNYYVYADDIDEDGVVELPELITMQASRQIQEYSMQHLIRWYSMRSDGSEADKMFTYHNFEEGWYVELEADMADRTLVTKSSDGGYSFYFWDEEFTQEELIFTLYMLTGDDRLAAASEEGLSELLKTDSAVYVAVLEPAAVAYGVSADYLSNCFRLIQTDWKTGEM